MLRQQGTLTDYRYLVSCWDVLRRTDRTAAAALLAAIRKKLPLGVKAQFPGPDGFSGGGRLSRVTVINTAPRALHVILAGPKGAYLTDMPPCSVNYCSNPGATTCRGNVNVTIAVPPGTYWMLMLNEGGTEDVDGGSRGLWVLPAGRADQCVQ